MFEYLQSNFSSNWSFASSESLWRMTPSMFMSNTVCIASGTGTKQPSLKLNSTILEGIRGSFVVNVCAISSFRSCTLKHHMLVLLNQRTWSAVKAHEYPKLRWKLMVVQRPETVVQLFSWVSWPLDPIKNCSWSKERKKLDQPDINDYVLFPML